MIEAVLILSQVILVASVLYYIYVQSQKGREEDRHSLETFTQTVSGILTHMADENKNLYEAIGKMQEKYFASLEKHSTNQDKVLEKQQKEFLETFEEVFKKEEVIKLPEVLPTPTGEANNIEAAEPDEVPLSETDRIPMVEGLRVKFEDYENIYPMNITPVEGPQGELI